MKVGIDCAIFYKTEFYIIFLTPQMGTQITYKPTRQSNAIGMAMTGIVGLVVSFAVYRWKVGPYLKNKKYERNKEYAEIVFKAEQQRKLEAESGGIEF